MAGYRMTEYEEIAKFYEREKERMKADLEEERQKNAEKDARIRELEAALSAK